MISEFGLLPVTPLEPALSGHVAILVLVFLKRSLEAGDSIDRSGTALLGGRVDGRDVSQGRARREKREEVRRQPVRHGDDVPESIRSRANARAEADRKGSKGSVMEAMGGKA